jgi:type IV pilus assembly protein PilQ
MIPIRSNPGNSRLPVILLISLLMLCYGCPKRQATAELPISKQIVDIQITEEDNSWNCKITGNEPLAFSAIHNLTPAGLLLYFPSTRLNLPESDLPDPLSEIIGFVEAEEHTSGNRTDSRILIGLNVARPYRISANESDTLISFPKVLAKTIESERPSSLHDAEKTIDAQPEPRIASRLQQVTAFPMQDYIIVNIISDGTIRDYRSFSIDNPARIVFDFNHLKSPFSSTQTISVDSRWVKRIRYHSYPDKIRLVLDTEQPFLAKYFSFGIETGLLIYIGTLPEGIRHSMISAPPAK